MKCHHTWFQGPSSQSGQTPPLAPEAGEAANTPPLPPLAHETKTPVPPLSAFPVKAVVGKMVFIIVTFALLAVGGYLFKDDILFALSGKTHQNTYASYAKGPHSYNYSLNQTASGLIIEPSVERDIVTDNNLSILIFKGKITNTNTVDVPVTPTRVVLLNEQGIELDSFPALAQKQVLEPGESTEWICRFFNPPLEKISEYKAFFVES